MGATITAREIARAVATERRQVSHTADKFVRSDAYGYAPREKPAHTIHIAMENFNSLGIFLGNA